MADVQAYFCSITSASYSARAVTAAVTLAFFSRVYKLFRQEYKYRSNIYRTVFSDTALIYLADCQLNIYWLICYLIAGSCVHVTRDRIFLRVLRTSIVVNEKKRDNARALAGISEASEERHANVP